MNKILTILKRFFCVILGWFLGGLIAAYMEILFDPTYRNSGWGLFFVHSDHDTFWGLTGALGGALLGFWLPSNNQKTYRARIAVFFSLVLFILIATILINVKHLV